MSKKECGCQFCKDYEKFEEVLPKLSESDQEWLRRFTDSYWQTCDDLDFTKNLTVPKLKSQLAERDEKLKVAVDAIKKMNLVSINHDIAEEALRKLMQ